MARRMPFRNRAHEVSRIEAFSDVIFGFAVSLLVVSLEAPKSFDELMEMMRGFIPFAIAFFLLIDLWFEHHEFFRRYALHDRTITALNTVLLFVILFYVYPLKFVFVASVETILRRKNVITLDQAPTLFLVYGAGFAAVFLILGFMYRHAWKERSQLQLNEVEEIDTLESVYDNFASSAFGILSALLGFILPRNVVGLAGYVYFLIFIPKAVIPRRMRRKRRQVEDRLLSAPEPPG
jgi:uncharacterized membrane protein